MSDLITIGNDGQDIIETNYFDLDVAKQGYLYLSWNAGAARLLVPDSQLDTISEMKTGKYAVLTRKKLKEHGGREVLEVLFEDNSKSPFAIMMSIEQVTIPSPSSLSEKGFPLTVWTRSGKALQLSAKYKK